MKFSFAAAMLAFLVQQLSVQWDPVRLSEIGSVNGTDDALNSIKQVLITRSEEIVVALPLDRCVRVFDTHGKLLRTIGRAGKGPGEFESIEAIGVRNDTLYVTDNQLGRITFFSLEGRLFGTKTRTSPGVRRDPIAYAPTVPQVLLADGSALVQPNIGVRGGVDLRTLSIKVPIFRIGRQGQITDTLAWIDREKPAAMVDGPMGKIPVYDPFNTSPVTVMLRDGSGLVIVTPNERSTGNVFRVRTVGPTGEPVFSKTYSYRPRPMTAQAASQAAEQARLRLLREAPPNFPLGLLNSKQIESALRRAGRIPTTQVPIAFVISAQDGSIWLGRETDADGTRNWQVLNRHGQAARTVKLPAAETVAAASGTLLVSVKFGSFDIPMIIVYRLVRH